MENFYYATLMVYAILGVLVVAFGVYILPSLVLTIRDILIETYKDYTAHRIDLRIERDRLNQIKGDLIFDTMLREVREINLGLRRPVSINA
jgi:hypothetical protein